MKKIISICLMALAAACSGGSSGSTTTTGSGSGGSSGTSSSSGALRNITFTTIAIHPAAAAALADAGLPIPSLYAGGPGDAGYKLIVQGVALGLTAGGSEGVVLKQLASYPIFDGGTYAFSIAQSDIPSSATLGILAGISPALADGGTFSPPADGGLTQLDCSAVNGAGGIAAALSAAQANGLFDYYFPSGSQVGGQAVPPSADVTNGAAYAVPMSYASILNCAGQANKTTHDSDTGVGLVYVTNGTSATAGTPVSGATFALGNVSGTQPSAVYYSGWYTSESATPPTDVTGVATFTGINLGTSPPTVETHDSNNDTFFVPGIGTNANSFFNCFVYEQ